MEISNVLEIANWMGKTEDCGKLEWMENVLNERKYYLTFWGHFSAGKSKLINNILQRDILPVQSRETTALLTYICYGVEEKCWIHYEDGRSEEYGIEMVKKVFQNSEKVNHLDEIHHIEVWVNNELLQQGLILVDTPGINTVIQKHQQIAIDAIEQSGRIIYVLGSAPSSIDKEFISQIVKCGVEIIFVRTKCDTFKNEEESADCALQGDQRTLEELIGKTVQFIPVSNEKDTEYYANIEKLNKVLKNLSVDIENELKRSVVGRLQVIIKQYESELHIMNTQLKQVIDGNTEQIKQEIEQCTYKMNKLKSLSKDLEQKLQEHIKRTDREIRIELKSITENSVEKFKRKLLGIDLVEDIEKKAHGLCETEWKNVVYDIQKVLNRDYNGIVEMELKELSLEAENCEFPTFTEIRQDNSRLLETCKGRLLELKQEIEKLSSQRKENHDNLEIKQQELAEDDYDEQMEILNRGLESIPSDIAMKVADYQPVQPSKILKNIGNALDLALLVLPGETVAAGIKGGAGAISKAGKALTGAGKATKVAEATKAGKTMLENINVIDRVRDTTYLLNNLFKNRRTSEKKTDVVDVIANDVKDKIEERKKNVNVLDMISVAYWMEKIGENFDQPPRMEVDYAIEHAKEEKRQEIMSQQEKLSEARIQKKIELGLIDSKEKELKIKQEEKQEILKRTEAEMSRISKELEEESHRKALAVFRERYINFFEENIYNASEKLSDTYLKLAIQNIPLYATRQNAELYRKIEERKIQMETLLTENTNDMQKLKCRLAECDKYLKAIEGVC